MKFVLKEILYSKKGRWLILLRVVLSITTTALTTGQIYMIGRVLENRDIRTAIIFATITVADILIGTLLIPIEKIGMASVYSDLNNKYGGILLSAPVGLYIKYSPSTINTAGESMYGIVRLIEQSIIFIRSAVTVISSIVTMVVISSISTILPLIGVYIVGSIALVIVSKQFVESDKKQAVVVRNRNQELENIAIGFNEVRGFNTQQYHNDRVIGFNLDILKIIKSRSKISASVTGILWSVDGLALGLIIWIAINQINSGIIGVAAGLTLVMYVMRLTDPLYLILNMVDSISSGLSHISVYKEIVEFKNNKEDGKIVLSSFDDCVELDDVSFSYDDSKEVLRGINMKFEKGKKIGICGVSGCGKSTIFKLLNRFYTPNSGSIRVDGFDIGDITAESYHNKIGGVMQENQIFPGTIWDNLKYGSPNALESEVLEATKKANLYELINSWPDRFNTLVGPRGITLSGGQKQRIALARLFLKNPDIVLLDEATSALDNESEKLIQDAISNLDGKTVIAIAHRLSTIKDCDLIYVLSPNGVVEAGNHQELMELNGVYANMQVC